MTADSTHAVVNSYSSPAMELISWQDTYTIPLEYKISTIADIEFILTAPGAPMAGGSIVPDSVETVDCARARKWGLTKLERDRRINGTFTTSLGTVQIDDRSILALATTRRILLTADATVEWTMADNGTADLTSAEIDAMLTEVARYTADVHAASQALRALIYAKDANIADVEAINVLAYGWPAPTVEIEDEAPSPAPVEDEPESPPEPEDRSETP